MHGFVKPAPLLTFGFLFLLGVAVLFFRNPDPFVNPILYAEDGIWMQPLLFRKFGFAYWRIREPYPVIGNILMLHGALEANRLFFGKSLYYLPLFVSGIAVAAQSAIAAFSWIAFRRVWAPVFGLAAYCAVILVPIGWTANEVIGRVSNFGFFMPALAMALIVHREAVLAEGATWRRVALHDAFLLLAAMTNPIVVGIVGAYLAFKAIAERQILPLRTDRVLVALFAVLACWITWRIAILPNDAHPYLRAPFVASGFIEMGIAKSVLYPLAFSFFWHLSDLTALLACAAFAALAILGFRVRRAGRFEGAVILAALAITAGAIIATRPGLTVFASGYVRWWADRYFVGQNLLAVFLTLWALNQLAATPRPLLRRLGYAGAVCLASVYIAGMPLLFETTEPSYALKLGPTFAEQVGRAMRDPANATGDRINVQIEAPPWPWVMAMPRSYGYATSQNVITPP
jgi:hypothetical protein